MFFFPNRKHKYFDIKKVYAFYGEYAQTANKQAKVKLLYFNYTFQLIGTANDWL